MLLAAPNGQFESSCDSSPRWWGPTVNKAESGPMSIAAIANALDVHPNTVPFHLDTLVSDGRVEHVGPDRNTARALAADVSCDPADGPQRTTPLPVARRDSGDHPWLRSRSEPPGTSRGAVGAAVQNGCATREESERKRND